MPFNLPSRAELRGSGYRQWVRFRHGLTTLRGRAKQWPSLTAGWFSGLHWNRLLTVRRGFLFGAFSGFFAAGSILWAIPAVLPYLPGHASEPIPVLIHNLPIAREFIPSELGWFFIQFPYISESAKIRAKNHHSFMVDDAARRRQYVVTLGQRYRRVEIYNALEPGEQQVQIFTPGSKRIVSFNGDRIVGQSTVPDGNLWMWNQPLWNAIHLKIYGLADLWLDSPYKKFSCAGFAHQFLSDAGVHVPILDAWDIARQPWTRVPIDELEPGDLITFKALTAQHRRFWGHRVTHVGVYIGNGKFIHAATSSPRAKRSWVRLADVQDFRNRIDKILRPPELL